MRCDNCRPVSSMWLSFLLAIPAIFTGCLSFHEYRPMRVLVRDAETKQPRSDVEVEGWYATMLDVFGPRRPSGVTGPDGIATLQVGMDRSFTLRVQQVGYLMTDVREGLTAEFVKQLPKNGHRGAKDVDYVIDVPPDPSPTLVLVVPDHYRGLLRIRFESAEDVAVAPQRTYTVDVGADGRAEVRLPKAVWAAKDGRNIAAREKSGRPVPWEPNSSDYHDHPQVALRRVASTEDTELYVIGIGKEQAALDEQVRPYKPGGRREFDQAAYNKLFDK